MTEPKDETNRQSIATDSTQKDEKATQAADTGATKSTPAKELKLDKGIEEINRVMVEKATIEKAQKLGMPYVNVSDVPINMDLIYLLEKETAEKAMVVPFFRIGKKLRIAVYDPENVETKKVIQEFRDQGYLLNISLASDPGIHEVFKLYDSEQYKVKKKSETKYEKSDVTEYEKELVTLSELKEKLKKVPSEEGLHLINIGAIRSGASDIHYEPQEDVIRVRFRIDGILHKVFDITKNVFKNLKNQLKYIAKMKLNISNVPQDGRYSFMYQNRKIDVRVNSLPTQFDETIVCRLLDSGKEVLTFEEMGFEEDNLKKMNKITKLNDGMILVTGPTGSGKTTTLYSIMNALNEPGVKIISLEDPIEYNMKGISQSQINEKRGYNFADGLRAILRQDPDVVMVGEIRDIDTAQTSSQAALTGHVVLSTLHTNSAIESIPRLINMGLPPFMVAPAIDTIIAQRLVRKICPHCQIKRTVKEAKLEQIKGIVEQIKRVKPNIDLEIPKKMPASAGCDKCSHTGYIGRVAIAEIINIDFEMKELILNNESSNKMLLAARRKGFINMLEDGIMKVIQGLTTLEEVYRVANISNKD